MTVNSGIHEKSTQGPFTIIIATVCVSRVTYQKAVLDGTKGQSVQSVMNSAVDLAALPPKAHCVDDTAPPLP